MLLKTKKADIKHMIKTKYTKIMHLYLENVKYSSEGVMFDVAKEKTLHLMLQILIIANCLYISFVQILEKIFSGKHLFYTLFLALFISVCCIIFLIRNSTDGTLYMCVIMQRFITLYY